MHKTTVIAAIIVLVGAVHLWTRLTGPEDASPRASRSEADNAAAIAVRLAPIERRTIVRAQVFSGTIEASAETIVAPEIAGRIRRLHVDLADRVHPNTLLAELDDAEFRQAVAEARADVSLAKAELRAAEHALEIARRQHARVEALAGRGIAPQQQLDGAWAESRRAEAAVATASARRQAARARLELATLRASHTQVRAQWDEALGPRVVAQRHVDAGHSIAAKAPLFTLVDLDPVRIVLHVTERDYADLQPGQLVRLSTDSYPERNFSAHVDRIAPVFRAESRQARVELRADNPERLLKPGMFVRAHAELEKVERALVVPRDAIAKDAKGAAIFVADTALAAKGPTSVRRVAVVLGLVQGDAIEVRAPMLTNARQSVVTLGKERLRDGSTIVVPTAPAPVDSESRDPGRSS